MDHRVWHDFYDTGVPASIDYEEITIPEILMRSVKRHGDRPAVSFMNCQLTYEQLNDQVRRLATALAALGVEKDTRVAIHLPNLPQTVIAFFATARLGAQIVMTNPLYTEREIEHQWTDSGVSVAIVLDALFARRIKGMRNRLPVKHYIVASIPEYLRFPLNLLAPLKLKKQNPPMVAKVQPGTSVHLFKKLVSNTEPEPPGVAVSIDDVLLLQYTGGTTGVSKGAMLTHRNISCNVQQATTWITGLNHGNEALLACLPYFHIFGLTISLNFPVYFGGLLVLMPNPRDIPGVIKNIEKHKVTLLPAVPAIFNAITQFPGIEKHDLTSVKVCASGSAPLPVSVIQRFEALTGVHISEGFGMTETSPATHFNPMSGTKKEGSIGPPWPDTDARIVDLEHGATEMPVGTEGELVVSGPQVMKGYWNRPDETNEMIRDGWLHTGDIAKMDEQGYFYIVGRMKDMIICSGCNVYPDEVDEVLVAHPAVTEAATIGIPDERRGETVKSFVVLKPEYSTTAEELIEHCKEQLASYKVPREIEFRESLPKSTVLKILRRELRDEEMAKSGG
ncbi:long-chain fatty acid--CoA ligase [Gemmatimonadota bacterium]